MAQNVNQSKVEGWSDVDGHLERNFVFPDFKTALDFVNLVGDIAEKHRHHPDINLSFGKVKINLITHSTKTVTEKDVLLAEEIGGLYKLKFAHI
jgi:4a-hydroxytetrahydrobiopterin dehydratase